MLTMFSAFGEFEAALMKERQRAGIDKARRDGRSAGRKPTARLNADEVRALWSEGVSAAEIAERLSISRASVYSITTEEPERSAEIARAWKR